MQHFVYARTERLILIRIGLETLAAPDWIIRAWDFRRFPPGLPGLNARHVFWRFFFFFLCAQEEILGLG
jgi:hypothetical protein